MNVILIDKCTNYCAYCFASTLMAKNAARAGLSRESIEELVAFVSRSGPDFHLNLIGGEPFLFQDLGYLLENLCREPGFGRATIFTGAIFVTRALEQLAPYRDRIALLVNLNERRDYKKASEYEVVLKNMSRALEMGIRTTVGFNIWREDFDYEEILDVCREHGVEQLRWTVAYPEASPMVGVAVLTTDTYPQVARRCAEFLEAAFEAGIEAYLDCPLPKCFFSLDELGRIALTHPKTVSQIRSCGPVIDVSPTLDVFRCYALSNEHRQHLSNFRNFNELTAWYQQAIDDRYARPQVFDACDTCEFAENRTCYGGCMAHSVVSLNGLASREDLFRRAHTALAEGDFARMEQALLQLPAKDAPSSLLWTHLEWRRGNLQKARIYARMTINRSRTETMREIAAALLQQINALLPATMAEYELPILETTND